MQSEEQQLIERLFSRLQQAGHQAGPRDAAAETLIQQQLRQQPDAPYYMTQALLVQEAAMKKLTTRISELENSLKQAAQPQHGGFLSSLFGDSQPTQTPPGGQATNSAPAPAYPAQAPAMPRGTSFLGGALQTAVGVAGGMAMAEMLTQLFHSSQPQEIVKIINAPSTSELQDNDNDTFLPQDTGFSQDYTDNNVGSDGSDDDFSNDDNFI